MKEIDNQDGAQTLRSEDLRNLALKADGYSLLQDIMYVPIDEEAETGGVYEYRDGTPVTGDALRVLVQLGAL